MAIYSRQGQYELMSVNDSARRHNRDIFPIFFSMKVSCAFPLESPHRGDSKKYTQYTIINIKKKQITLNFPQSAAMGSF